MPRAFTRAVSRAAAQHDAYERALSDAGFEVHRLPELRDDPDAVFVEDTALLLDGHAVITRPGAPSRAGEVESTADGLAGQFELHRIERGFVDGGDVLRVGRSLYVGASTRTDADGISALRDCVAPLGYEVVQAELRNCLHLKTGATFAALDAHGTPVLLYNERAVDPRQFAHVDPMAVDDGEPAAANCLRVGDRLILPAGNPRTAGQLRDRGFQVVEVDVSELQKAEAGVTCMSLIDQRP